MLKVAYKSSSDIATLGIQVAELLRDLDLDCFQKMEVVGVVQVLVQIEINREMNAPPKVAKSAD